MSGSAPEVIEKLLAENEQLRNWVDEKRGFVDAPHPINCNAVLGNGECDCFTNDAAGKP